MDPIMRAWMFNSWAEDYTDEWKLLESQAILTGSFTNPEAAKKMLGTDGTKHVSSEEEFEELSRQIRNESLQDIEEQNKKKRRRRKILAI